MKRTDSIAITIPGERYTPFLLAKKLGAKAVLESASFSHGRDRYSLLLVDEAFRILQDDEGVAFIVGGKRLPFRQGERCDVLDALQKVADENEPPKAEIPLPAAGIGYLSYEFCARCDTIHLAPQKDELKIPESEFIVGHIYMVFDHFSEQIHIFAQNYDEHEVDLKAEVAKLTAELSDSNYDYLAVPSEPEDVRILTDLKKSEEEYKQKVVELKKRIVAGDIVQAVPSRRLRIESKAEAIEVYRRLRTVNPSPYLFYLDYGTHQLVGASPESLVRVRAGVASIRPIAGTRRRGKNRAEDEALEKELLSDPKERAEHLMLVDLARNDLGRVCKPGTVKMVRSMKCEFFSHVIHIVSDVQGEPSPTKRSIDVLRSAFPAGTVSGAPKISAIEILSTLEDIKRNFYAGGVGYLQSNGDLDFCIALRCALKQGNVWSLQSGGGIVHASNPDREWEETNEKLGAMRAVLEGDKK